MSDKVFLRLPQVLARIPVSKSSWWDGVRTGRFPKSIKLGARITVWLKSDIDQLIEKSLDGNKISSNSDLH